MWYASSLLNNDGYQRMDTLSMLNCNGKKNNSNDEIEKYLHKTENRSYLDI